MNKKMNIGLIGAGHLGTRHLKALQELPDNVNLAGVCDTRLETKALAEAARVPFMTRYQDLLGKVDAVDICTPTVAHYAIAKYFLQNGIHVFVEKPMTTTLGQADKLIALAQNHGLVLQVGHIERFNAAFEAIRPLIRNPRFIECHRMNRFPNRSLDIGVVMDLMIHDIDIVLGLNSSGVKSVQAIGVKVLTPLEDIANARLTFLDGCVCDLTASRVSEEVLRKIRIFLNDSYISLDYVAQEAYIYKKVDGRITKEPLPIEKEEPLKKELTAFINCVTSRQKPVVSGAEGREALKLALDITKRIWKAPQNT